jgi:HD-GYP domain-containing protein (c-di-GMP phosphodiesterase class II)
MERIDDVFEQNVAKHGRSFINNLSILVKLTDIYDSTNDAMLNAANRFIGDLKPLLHDSDDLSVKTVDESFFIEDIRIKSSATDIDNFSALSRILDKRGIGTLTFRSSLNPESLINILYTLKKGNDASEIQSILEQSHEGDVTIEGPVFAQIDDNIDLKDTRLVAKRSYIKALSALMEIHENIKSGKNMNVKRAKRTIQSLVDCILKEEAYVLGLTTHRNIEHYYYAHSINVTILSIALGNRIGLSKYKMSILGMAALFHDIGKAELAEDYQERSTEFSKKEIELVQKHPEYGVKLLMRTRGLSEISMLSMLVSFEHHMNLDMMGYPQPSRAWVPNIFSKIVRIADDYDSFVSGRVYGHKAFSVQETLEILQNNSGKSYDPALIKAFLGFFRAEA